MNKWNTSIEFDEEKKRGYKKILWTILSASIVVAFFYGYYSFYKGIPNKMTIRKGEEQSLEFFYPVSAMIYKDSVYVDNFNSDSDDDLNQAITVSTTRNMVMRANEIESYAVDIKLFGVIPIKTMDLNVIDEKKVYPVGLPIGIYVKTEGVLVIGIGSVTGMDHNSYEPAKHILKPGDYILEVNGYPVSRKTELINIIKKSNGTDLVLTVLRNNEKVELLVKPVLSSDKEYKIGIWIRDSAQGIGTMTYVDENGKYGALGHGINDVDTSALMKLNQGGVYTTSIVGIQKGQNGSPGELTGMIDFQDENKLGNVSLNTKNGIFGNITREQVKKMNLTSMDIALKQEAHTGGASVLCKIENKTKLYDIEIVQINYESMDDNRGLVVEIVDDELIDLTGGIVQGMSGAPIIQDGKVLGAITHVLVKDATKGYGIFIENMLAQ